MVYLHWVAWSMATALHRKASSSTSRITRFIPLIFLLLPCLITPNFASAQTVDSSCPAFSELTGKDATNITSIDKNVILFSSVSATSVCQCSSICAQSFSTGCDFANFHTDTLRCQLYTLNTVSSPASRGIITVFRGAYEAASRLAGDVIAFQLLPSNPEGPAINRTYSDCTANCTALSSCDFFNFVPSNTPIADSTVGECWLKSFPSNSSSVVIFRNGSVPLTSTATNTQSATSSQSTNSGLISPINSKSSTPSASSTSQALESTTSSVNVGLIVGLVVAFIVLGLAAAIFIFLWVKKRQKRGVNGSSSPPEDIYNNYNGAPQSDTATLTTATTGTSGTVANMRGNNTLNVYYSQTAHLSNSPGSSLSAAGGLAATGSLFSNSDTPTRQSSLSGPADPSKINQNIKTYDERASKLYSAIPLSDYNHIYIPAGSNPPSQPQSSQFGLKSSPVLSDTKPYSQNYPPNYPSVSAASFDQTQVTGGVIADAAMYQVSYMDQPQPSPSSLLVPMKRYIVHQQCKPSLEDEIEADPGHIVFVYETFNDGWSKVKNETTEAFGFIPNVMLFGENGYPTPY